jgi:undecaprenyl-phosphate 4-deoxy-4-formamido-L-arabinose transferase
MATSPGEHVHDVAVVIPVYLGAATLEPLVDELRPLLEVTTTPEGRRYRVVEVVLVHDRGPDGSAEVIGRLCREPAIRAVWLARNSGQHAATVAGIASTSTSWVVTMDEDGQHVPADIGRLLDRALSSQVHLVYGRPSEGAPHSPWRNATSSAAKWLARTVAGSDLSAFTSYRLVEGSRARTVCAYVGRRTFLDSALTWGIDRSEVCPTSRRREGRTESGYDLGRLLSHFWTLVLSSGNRPLRIVSTVGGVVAGTGLVGAGVIVWRRIQPDWDDAPGWASVMVVQLVLGGGVLTTLGVVAEYVGALLRIVQGQPLYIAVDAPEHGPLAKA